MVAVFLLLVSLGDPEATDRPRHPIAPSLPLLTSTEEKRYEEIVERFIQYDTGKLTGAAGKKALADFDALPPEAFFVLLDGFNRAANLEASCPAVIIGKKIAGILRRTEDVELVTFARENLGAGVQAKRHLGTVKDLQLACILRRGELQQRGITSRPPVRTPASLSLVELAKAIEKAQGPPLRTLLTEAEKRSSPAVPKLLATAMSRPETDVRQLGQDLLKKHLQRQPSAKLKDYLKHERSEVRITAAQIIGAKRLPCEELIALLDDAEPAVQQAGRQALVQLSGGVDHGPEPDASVGDRLQAQQRWRAWWAAAKGR